MNKVLLSGFVLNLLGKLDACVYLTVSCLPPDILEVNWNCRESIESIAVYHEDPRQDPSSKPLVNFSVPDQSKKYIKTNITFDPEPFPGGWSKDDKSDRIPKSQCLYWVVARFQERPTYYDCYKIQPAWMSENKVLFRNLSLPLMFIPGTHNSGTDSMKSTKKRGISHIDNFVLTQDQSVWNQLVYGIRFLDFRVGYYPNPKNSSLRFWINHDLLRVQPLLPVLKDVVEFLKSSPDEIIILDFHRFPAGFRSKNSIMIHRELVEMIGKEIKDLAVLRPLSQTKLKLGEIWNSNKRIIVSYSEENMVWETPWLWSSVSQRWGNKQTPGALEKFLDSTFREVVSRKLWAAMAELTPTPLDFLSNGSLRSMADSVNRLLTTWLNERRNWTSRANIVAPDFFLGTNLINIAITENLGRAKEIEALEAPPQFENLCIHLNKKSPYGHIIPVTRIWVTR